MANIGSVTEPLSQYLDFFIKKFVKTVPSYLGDTTDILKLIDSYRCEDNVILVSFDVKNLYGCIPHEVGLKALKHYLDTRPTEMQPPTSFLLELAKIILTKNFFQYGGSYYLQTLGVSMGSSFSPSFSILTVARWEDEYIYSSKNPFSTRISLWGRYIDDIICAFNGDEEELEQFILYMNSTTDFLRFTAEYDVNKVNFLDLTISKSDDVGFSVEDGAQALDTTIYRKPVSRNSLLRADSNHPSHIIKNIPIGQFLRLRRNCSTDMDFNEKAKEMVARFLERGYPKDLLDEAWARALRTDRKSLLVKKTKVAGPQRLCFASEFNPRLGAIKNIILKHWHILQSDTTK